MTKKPSVLTTDHNMSHYMCLLKQTCTNIRARVIDSVFKKLYFNLTSLRIEDITEHSIISDVILLNSKPNQSHNGNNVSVDETCIKY